MSDEAVKPPRKKKRQTHKAKYVIVKQMEVVEVDRELQDTEDAIKWCKEHDHVGEVRIAAVKTVQITPKQTYEVRYKD